ncbi:MAG TPA: hypothetical protein VN038_04800 [Dyadobacter sp.]|nr:hypothetical protein [Dyadobacter sp.]
MRIDLFQQCVQLRFGHVGFAHVQARKPVCEELVDNNSFPRQHYRVGDNDEFHYK